MRPLKREEKAIIYVINHLNYLKEQGVLEGGGYKVNNTPELVEEMKGFEPTEEETRVVMEMLQNS